MQIQFTSVYLTSLILQHDSYVLIHLVKLRCCKGVENIKYETCLTFFYVKCFAKTKYVRGKKNRANWLLKRYLFWRCCVAFRKKFNITLFAVLYYIAIRLIYCLSGHFPSNKRDMSTNSNMEYYKILSTRWKLRQSAFAKNDQFHFKRRIYPT